VSSFPLHIDYPLHLFENAAGKIFSHLAFDISYSGFFVRGIQINFRIDQIISGRCTADESSYAFPVLRLRSVLIAGNHRPASQVEAFNRKQNISPGYCPGVKNLHFSILSQGEFWLRIFYTTGLLFLQPGKVGIIRIWSLCIKKSGFLGDHHCLWRATFMGEANCQPGAGPDCRLSFSSPGRSKRLTKNHYLIIKQD